MPKKGAARKPPRVERRGDIVIERGATNVKPPTPAELQRMRKREAQRKRNVI